MHANSSSPTFQQYRPSLGLFLHHQVFSLLTVLPQSAAVMSPQIHDLPDELLVDILDYLPKVDVKEARLTCTRCTGPGALFLFQRVYFAPRQNMIQSFVRITEHPVSSQTIQEIVYDAMLFQTQYTDEEARFHLYLNARFCSDVDSDSDDDSQGEPNEERSITRVPANPYAKQIREHYDRCYDRYQKLVAEQEDILGKGHDHAVLCAAFKRIQLASCGRSTNYLVVWQT